MRKLWLLLFPALFLPELGFSQQTPFGVLKIADFIIFPYLLSVYLAVRFKKKRHKLMVDQLWPWLVAFLWWAIIATVLFPMVHGGQSDSAIILSLFKLGKASLYTVAAIFTVKALSNQKLCQQFHWALLVSGAVTGISLLIGRYYNPRASLIEVAEQLYVENVVSAMLAILISYLLALFLSGYGSKQWRWSTILGLLIMVFGILLSNGRGGLFAALVAIAYLLYCLRLFRVVGVLFVGIVIITVSYNQFSVFRDQVDLTFNPDPRYLARYNVGIGGIDTGARLPYWKKEGIKLIDAPIFGRGFFHRGGQSSLDPVGSHNFFIQMFLETGIVGGMLILIVFLKMWRQAGSRPSIWNKIELPAKAAILAAFVAGLSGEYFYGGMVLFTLFISYASLGRLPVAKSRKRPRLSRGTGENFILQERRAAAKKRRIVPPEPAT